MQLSCIGSSLLLYLHLPVGDLSQSQSGNFMINLLLKYSTKKFASVFTSQIFCKSSNSNKLLNYQIDFANDLYKIILSKEN